MTGKRGHERMIASSLVVPGPVAGGSIPRSRTGQPRKRAGSRCPDGIQRPCTRLPPLPRAGARIAGECARHLLCSFLSPCERAVSAPGESSPPAPDLTSFRMQHGPRVAPADPSRDAPAGLSECGQWLAGAAGEKTWAHRQPHAPPSSQVRVSWRAESRLRKVITISRGAERRRRPHFRMADPRIPCCGRASFLVVPANACGILIGPRPSDCWHIFCCRQAPSFWPSHLQKQDFNP